jgi:hypothetical protein
MAVGTNALQSEAHTSTATSEVLVRPNVDTLYSRSAIDLSQSDLVLLVPEVPDNRFYVAPFYDLSVASILPDSSIASSQLLTLASLDMETNSPMSDSLLTVRLEITLSHLRKMMSQGFGCSTRLTDAPSTRALLSILQSMEVSCFEFC